MWEEFMNQKEENFKRIAENRTNKIIKVFSKKSFYQYSDEQINAIFDSIQNELDKQRNKFKKDVKARKFEL